MGSLSIDMSRFPSIFSSFSLENLTEILKGAPEEKPRSLGNSLPSHLIWKDLSYYLEIKAFSEYELGTEMYSKVLKLNLNILFILFLNIIFKYMLIIYLNIK